MNHRPLVLLGTPLAVNPTSSLHIGIPSDRRNTSHTLTDRRGSNKLLASGMAGELRVRIRH